jgi:hypothetical protein
VMMMMMMMTMMTMMSARIAGAAAFVSMADKRVGANPLLTIHTSHIDCRAPAAIGAMRLCE